MGESANKPFFILVKTPFDTYARIAHEAESRITADEVVTEFYLRADMQVRTFEPPPYIVP